MSDKNYIPCDSLAQEEVKNVMKYLSDMTYEGIITGQHTQTMEQEELKYINKITDRLPALVGFELLSYSPNINYDDIDEECYTEIVTNQNTLERAWDWAKEKGLITFCWHWFSPLGGKSKSFYTKNTDYDASLAVIDGTPENIALLHDMDVMAELLRPFAKAHVPILWRPFHEGDGDWFWWGAKGADTVKKLYRMMYERYTNYHELHNLIWVWNAPGADYYPGDDVVDIISRDMYPPAHNHDQRQDMYDNLIQSTSCPKICFIGETGTIPGIDALSATKSGWVSYMTWSKEFCCSEDYTTEEELKKMYSHEYAITKDKLPILY